MMEEQLRKEDRYQLELYPVGSSEWFETFSDLAICLTTVGGYDKRKALQHITNALMITRNNTEFQGVYVRALVELNTIFAAHSYEDPFGLLLTTELDRLVTQTDALSQRLAQILWLQLEEDTRSSDSRTASCARRLITRYESYFSEQPIETELKDGLRAVEFAIAKDNLHRFSALKSKTNRNMPLSGRLIQNDLLSLRKSEQEDYLRELTEVILTDQDGSHTSGLLFFFALHCEDHDERPQLPLTQKFLAILLQISDQRNSVDSSSTLDLYIIDKIEELSPIFGHEEQPPPFSQAENFAPLQRQELSRIAEAQPYRGIDWNRSAKISDLPQSWRTIIQPNPQQNLNRRSWNAVMRHVGSTGVLPDVETLFAGELTNVHLEKWGLVLSNGEIIPYLMTVDEQGTPNFSSLDFGTVKAGETYGGFPDGSIRRARFPRKFELGGGYQCIDHDSETLETKISKRFGSLSLEYSIKPLSQEISVKCSDHTSTGIREIEVATHGFQRGIVICTEHDRLHFSAEGTLDLLYVIFPDGERYRSIEDIPPAITADIEEMLQRELGITFKLSTSYLDSNATLENLFKNINQDEPTTLEKLLVVGVVQ